MGSSVIDLSTVPAEDVSDAVLSKVLTMRVGERLEVTDDYNLEGLGPWLQRSRPGQVVCSIVPDNNGGKRLSVRLAVEPTGSTD